MTLAEKLLRDPELNAYVQNRFRDTGLKTRLRLSNPEKYRKADAAYYVCHREQYIAKATRRARLLGFVPMNQPFVGCEGHHLDKVNVIYIPHALHRSTYHNVWTGKGMSEINAKACAWMTEDWT